MAKEDPDENKDRAREAVTAADDTSRRKEDDIQRTLCTLLDFHVVCSHARCRRARQCTGDVDTCFRTFWPLVPEIIKTTIRRTITLVAGGMAPAEALCEAEAYAEECERKDAERRAAAQAEAAPVMPTPPPGTGGPRIRSL